MTDKANLSAPVEKTESWQVDGYTVTRGTAPGQFKAVDNKHPDVVLQGTSEELDIASACRKRATRDAIADFAALLDNLPMATTANRDEDIRNLRYLIERYPAEADAMLALVRHGRLNP